MKTGSPDGVIAKRAEQSLGDVGRVGKKWADLVTDAAFPQDPVALQLAAVDEGQADRMRLADPALEEPIAGREEMRAVVSRERGEGHLRERDDLARRSLVAASG